MQNNIQDQITTNSKKTYNEKIENLAKDKNGGIGFKAANLTYLQDKLGEQKTKVGEQKTKAMVPQFFAIPHNTIKKILEANYQNYQQDWTKLREEQFEGKNLLSNVQKGLEEISERVKNALLKYPEEKWEEIIKTIDGAKDLMVRSTGNEDAADLANPGGNESHPAENNTQSIINSIALVVSSYFKGKSIQQALSCNTKWPEEPFLPVLIQEMISSDEEYKVVSGVMHSFKDETCCLIIKTEAHNYIRLRKFLFYLRTLLVLQVEIP